MRAALVALLLTLGAGCASLKPPPPLASFKEKCDKPPAPEAFWYGLGFILEIAGQILACH